MAYDPKALKADINEILFKYLPETTTLKDMNKVSSDIYGILNAVITGTSLPMMNIVRPAISQSDAKAYPRVPTQVNKTVPPIAAVQKNDDSDD